MTGFEPRARGTVYPRRPCIDNTLRVESVVADQQFYEVAQLVRDKDRRVRAGKSMNRYGTHVALKAPQSISSPFAAWLCSSASAGFSSTSCTESRGALLFRLLLIQSASSASQGAVAHQSPAVGFVLSLSTASPASIASSL